MPDPQTVAELVTELRALLEKATPGPWRLWDGYAAFDGSQRCLRIGNDAGRGIRAGHDDTDLAGSREDFELVAEAVNALPRLLAALEAGERLRASIRSDERNIGNLTISLAIHDALAAYDAASGRGT